MLNKIFSLLILCFLLPCITATGSEHKKAEATHSAASAYPPLFGPNKIWKNTLILNFREKQEHVIWMQEEQAYIKKAQKYFSDQKVNENFALAKIKLVIEKSDGNIEYVTVSFPYLFVSSLCSSLLGKSKNTHINKERQSLKKYRDMLLQDPHPLALAEICNFLPRHNPILNETKAINEHYYNTFSQYLINFFEMNPLEDDPSRFMHSEQGIILAFQKLLSSENDDLILQELKQSLIELVNIHGEGCIIHALVLDILSFNSICNDCSSTLIHLLSKFEEVQNNTRDFFVSSGHRLSDSFTFNIIGSAIRPYARERLTEEIESTQNGDSIDLEISNLTKIYHQVPNH